MKRSLLVHTLLLILLPICLIHSQTDAYRTECLDLLEKGEAAKALEKMTEAVKIAPEIAENCFVLGKAHNAMKNGKAALLDFQKADSLKLASSEFYLIYGITFFDVGNNKEAFNCLLNCTFHTNSVNDRFKSYIPEVTKAYLGKKQMSNSNAEKYFFSLKNN